MRILEVKFDVFHIFAHLGEEVLTSTHNLCFRQKIRKSLPIHTPVLLYKSGVKRDIHFTDMVS